LYNLNLADEYVALIPRILQSLRSGSGEDALMLLLAGMEQELLAGVPEDQRRTAAKALVHLRLDVPIK
jgi:hypothetical protein